MSSHTVFWGVLFLIGMWGCIKSGTFLANWKIWSKRERIVLIAFGLVALMYVCWIGLILFASA